jgi:hypothetical protein
MEIKLSFMDENEGRTQEMVNSPTLVALNNDQLEQANLLLGSLDAITGPTMPNLKGRGEGAGGPPRDLKRPFDSIENLTTPGNDRHSPRARYE